MLRSVDVSVVYPGGLQAISGIDLAFEPGSFSVLLGPSGAGKSTLLRCLNGLVRPTRGDVQNAEGSIFASTRALHRQRQQTGMIFQQHHLIGRQSAVLNVLLGRIGYQSTWRSFLPASHADRMLALRALERVGLLDRALSRADQLSGGQQQRVGIARAMAQQPSILLADEPVASLDPATAEHVLADLKRICREDRITAIVSLHQVDLARRFADRVFGLAGGRLVFQGGPDELSDPVLGEIYHGAAPLLAEAA